MLKFYSSEYSYVWESIFDYEIYDISNYITFDSINKALLYMMFNVKAELYNFDSIKELADYIKKE